MNALKELKEKLLERFKKVRGDFDDESDIDLLILVNIPVDAKVEEEISEIVYEIELKYDLARAMPFHQNVDKEGIKL